MRGPCSGIHPVPATHSQGTVRHPDRPAKEQERPMYISVLVRRLKPGRTYDDVVRAWYPATSFGISGRGPILARHVADVIESTELRGIHEVVDEFDFSTDES